MAARKPVSVLRSTRLPLPTRAASAITVSIAPTARPSAKRNQVREYFQGHRRVFDAGDQLDETSALVNSGLSLLPAGEDGPVTLEQIRGLVMAPVAWLVGIPWTEAQTAGSLFGIKVVANEFLAYVELVSLPVNSLSARSELILSYAFCSFSNFGSLAIMIGGLSSMAPERSAEIAALGLRALLAGFLSGCLTAC
jgi:hypothetical protein